VSGCWPAQAGRRPRARRVDNASGTRQLRSRSTRPVATRKRRSRVEGGAAVERPEALEMDEHRESFQARSSRSHPWKAGASSAAKQTTACRPRQSSRQDGVGRLLAPRERQRRACPRIVLLGTCPRWCTNQPHPDIGPLLAALYEHGVELLLTGRSHNYERLEPITPEGIPDPRDVTQFLIGPGRRNLRANTRPQLSISA
jgi:hypothetical protein